MISIPIDQLADKVGGRYKLVNLASLRAQELVEGFKPLVEAKEMKISEIVLRELVEGKVTGIGPFEPGYINEKDE